MQLKKYDLPVPRYTSYPTVPFWDQDSFTEAGYKDTLKTAFWESGKEVSIYIHLPFCESLCTYCACNTRITKNHEVEEPYIERVLKEWKLYLNELPIAPVIKEVHLGGGTPTFFSPKHLKQLINGLFQGAERSEQVHMSFEGHPGNTNEQHLLALYEVGFDRVSLGIQDFNEHTQKLINRRQTFEQVKKVTEVARRIGYTSVNYDVVYGLPGQSPESLGETIDQIITLSPDRIAYYSYAHLPGLRRAQKAYEKYLPTADDKLEFMRLGKEKFQAEGYHEIGMDHFVKPTDELMEAQRKGYLHRNFMGYTIYSSRLLIGLGVSSISDSWAGFVQNEKKVEDYYGRVDQGELPIIKGHLLTHEDRFFRQHILNLMCHFSTEWSLTEIIGHGLSLDFPLLDELKADGLITYDENGLTVTPEGKEVIRVICSALDARMNQDTVREMPMFSQSL